MAYETELGIPVMLARLEDRIHEGMHKALSLEWPGKFLASITPGADLSLVGPRMMLAIQERSLDRLDARSRELVGTAVGEVCVLLRTWVESGTYPTESAARSAERDEYSWMAGTLLALLRDAPVQP